MRKHVAGVRGIHSRVLVVGVGILKTSFMGAILG